MNALTSEITGHKHLAWGKQALPKSLEQTSISKPPPASARAAPILPKAALDGKITNLNRVQSPATQAPFSKVILNTIEKDHHNDGSVSETGNVEIARLRALVPKPSENVLGSNRGLPRAKLSQIPYKKRTKILFPQTISTSTSKRFVAEFDEISKPKRSPLRVSLNSLDKQQSPIHSLHLKSSGCEFAIGQVHTMKRWHIAKSNQSSQNSDANIQKPQNETSEKVADLTPAPSQTDEPSSRESPSILTTPLSAISNQASTPTSSLQPAQKFQSPDISQTKKLAPGEDAGEFPRVTQNKTSTYIPAQGPPHSPLLITKSSIKSPVLPTSTPPEPSAIDTNRALVLNTPSSLTAFDLGSKSISMQYFVMTDDEKVGFWNNYFRMIGLADKQVCSSPPRCAQEL